MDKKKDQNYTQLILNIKNLIAESKVQVYRKVNFILVQTYFEVGKYLVNYLKNNSKNEKVFFEKIAKDLKLDLGKGFSRSNLIYMRLFYLKYGNGQTVSDHLSWSHYIELLMIEDDFERKFYEKQIIVENWSVRDIFNKTELKLL